MRVLSVDLGALNLHNQNDVMGFEKKVFVVNCRCYWLNSIFSYFYINTSVQKIIDLQNNASCLLACDAVTGSQLTNNACLKYNKFNVATFIFIIPLC
jgi:hypothetical protein